MSLTNRRTAVIASMAIVMAGGAITVGVVAGVALFVGLIYVALRFSLVAPMMVAGLGAVVMVP